MNMNIREFSDTEKMRLAIEDIKRYQRAYIEANNVQGVHVRFKPGWYAVSGEGGWRFYRPTEFRNMTDRLEQRALKGKNDG